MIGKGVLREQFQPRACSGKKTSRSSQVKWDCENVVFIDVDSDSLDDVVIIDVPESVCSSSVPRKGTRGPFPGVISIDDDVDPRVIAESGGELDSDASTSKSCSTASDYMHNPEQLDDDDCCVVYERKSAFKFQKSRQTCSKNASGRNCFGFDLQPEIGSSESDCSDCEIIEGSFKKSREQWEKASLKRKYHAFNVQSGFDEQACVSGSHSYTNVEVENRAEPQSGTPECAATSSGNYMKENLFSSGASDDSCMDDAYFNCGMESTHQGTDQKVNDESFKTFKPGSVAETDPIDRNSNFGTCGEDSCPGSGWKSYNGVDVTGSSSENYMKENLFSSGASHDGHMGGTYFNTGMEKTPQESDQKVDDECFKTFKPGSVKEADSLDRNCNFGTCREDSCPGTGWKGYSGVGVTGSSRSNQEMSAKKYKVMSSNQEEIKNLVGHDKDTSSTKGGVSSRAACSCDASSGVRHVNCDRVFSKCHSSCHSQVNYGGALKEKVGHVPEEFLFCNTASPGKSDIRKPSDVRNELHAQHGDVSSSGEKDIINEREKLKETDEYKRAIEEEWASRQRQLQIQAEEAQRLRRRKKAESMRFLDMQRRQKQRVEEVRETQKKDEEKMNLKEQLRIEIRKHLNKLEMTCTDMMSLLRSLGIQVGGDFKPMSQEVHAAYKRALLKFHPDRASKSDMRQQVEAEERFKLISRMKEKFLS
ncbi:DnaJ domain containing protein [Quillaja saponaria]|uniref:DnaJ domain containing protein n=1 Tax=Quillaja saponaria TaxID=32244 RepID=A0AAD7L983_QUISA|nr:DnaJ domain containing protein [Quillaja saponaria]